MRLSQRFRELRQDISGVEPTVVRARDWSEMLANLCEELALMAEKAETWIEWRENYESEQTERQGDGGD